MLVIIPKKMFPGSTKLLLDTNIMIAYTGATCDTTPHKTGFVNLKDTTEEDSIQAASRENMISTKVGNLPVVQCNKYGEEVQGLTLKEVNLTPAKNISLFSLAKRQKRGWKLHGYDKAIWLTKRSRKVVFDIVINNQKGGLFCTYFKRNS